MEAERARQLLHGRREQVERALSEHARDARGLSDDDQDADDNAAHLHQDELQAGLDAELREELAAIARAERRLQEGTFGVSIESGTPIPDARLELIPWADRTRREQERYDRT